MRAKAALGAAPEVVREPDGRDRGDGRHRDPHDRADERKPQAAEAPRLRGERREQQVAELPPTVDEAGDVATRRAVLEVELDLADVEAGPKRVDRHPRLDAEAGRDREHLGARPRRERALPGQRLLDAASAAELDQAAGDALREPEPAAGAPREAGDGEVGLVLHERPQVADEVGIAEEERPLAALALGERQRLTLAPAGKRDDARARVRRDRGRPVARAVVRDDDLRLGKRRAQRRDRPTDPLLLVARGDEHRQPRLRHPLPATGGAGGGSGMIPSVAPLPTP